MLGSMQVRGFPDGSAGEESACNAGDTGSIPGSAISPEEGNSNLLQYSCLVNPMKRSPVGSSPRGHKSQTPLSD